MLIRKYLKVDSTAFAPEMLISDMLSELKASRAFLIPCRCREFEELYLLAKSRLL